MSGAARRWLRFRDSSRPILADRHAVNSTPGVLAFWLLCLAACTGREALGTTYDQRWAGTTTPESGRCPRTSPASMTLLLRDRSITFSPHDGVLVLRGLLGNDGSVHAALDGAGADHRPFPLRFDGQLIDSSVIGTYTSPICRAHVELRAPKPVPRTLFFPGNPLGLGNQ